MSAEALAEHPIWNHVIGQPSVIARLSAAVHHPVHAYLFLGQPGVGTARAARAFAGLVLSQDLMRARARATHDAALAHESSATDGVGDEGLGSATDADSPDLNEAAVDRIHRLALEAIHPDIHEIEPEGATIRVDDAKSILRLAQTSPMESARKFIIVHGVDVIEEAAIGRLLKIVEEPPPSTVFVLLAENVPPEIITIASRCVAIEFSSIPTNVLQVALIADGIGAQRAALAAEAAAGDLDRARLLATDDSLALRAELWSSIPERLDGRGATVVELVKQLQEGMDQAQAPLDIVQAEELRQLDERAEQLGERGLGRAAVIARHKRQAKAIRTDELRFGFALLSRYYRDRLRTASDRAAIDALDAITGVTKDLIRNPDEALLLQALLLRLHAATELAGGNR